MSFIFRRSVSTNDADKVENESAANEPSVEGDSQDASPETELSNEKLSGSEKKPRKSRTTFLKSLVGNSSRNNSSSSLASATSSNSSLNSALPPLPPIELSGYGPTVRHKLMDTELAGDIRNLIPARLQLFDTWYLVYSSEQHGISLNSLYRNSKPEHQLIEYNKRKKAEKGFAESVVNRMMVSNTPGNIYNTPQRRPQGYVLVVKDKHSSRFGAFLNENLKPIDHKRYYGNGECFLWKCEKYDPTKLTHNKNSSSSKSKSAFRFKAFMYTGINDNIIYSNHDFIAIGSSQGQNGLYIDKSLCKGVSYPHASSKSGHKFNSALATWKRLKSVNKAPSNGIQADVDNNFESDDSQVAGSELYLIENGPRGELFIFYLKEKVLEVWDWEVPAPRAERDTLYLQSRIQARSSFNIQSFRVVAQQKESYIAVAVVLENETDNVDILHITSTSIKIPSRIALPFKSENYSIKASNSFVCVGTDSGAVHVFRFDQNNMLLKCANTDSALANTRRSCCTIPGNNDSLDLGDENVILQTSCNDRMAIYDIIEDWLVYCPKRAEYAYLKKAKTDDNCRRGGPSLRDETLDYLDPVITNFINYSENKKKFSLFTPVKLPRSTPLYNKLMSSLSKTTLDGIFKVSELSSAKYKEYMESKLELNKLGKSIGKSLYSNIQKGSEFLKPNDNQILTIIDLRNDRSLATFKPSGGVSQVSFSPYDLQLATSNLRGDSLYIWDLYRLPIEISLVGKFIRGTTSAVVKNISWFNTEDDSRDTHSGFGCISKATGSAHWYNLNSILGEEKTSKTSKKLKGSKKSREKQQKNYWTLSAFDGDKFLNVLDSQIGVLTRAGSLKMIDPTNGQHYYEYKIPNTPTVEFSNPGSFKERELIASTGPKNPLAQAEIETCAPYLNLINYENVEFATYQYNAETFEEFGNDVMVDCLNVRTIPPAKESVAGSGVTELAPETSALNKIYIDQDGEDDL
ncbi:hypothetical protein CANMA_000556 [Candida margitis]|uniref:uncharacterized protein n=1 Tax=Candida margitis TaxID=1775924 RepID=UPI002226EAEE|nr:uncharacterized protein CANMA_000556 [Candida margitis]KAI5970393.1 hypothetical protein CANMA_000556 [Candida margitis]